MEYWSLEQAKLGKRAGQAAAGPDRRHHRRRRRDRRGDRARLQGRQAPRSRSSTSTRRRCARRAKELGGAALGVRCDVTDDAASVRAAFDRVVERFGGIDILVSNAGAAWQGRIGEVEEAVLRQSFELNFFAHQRVAQAAVRIMLAQGTGGALLFNVSKQAVNPGAEFRPLRPAQGGDAVPRAAIRARLRRRRHPRQRRQCRPHPQRPSDRRR